MDVESNIKLSPYSDEVHGVVGKFYGCHNYTEIEYLGKYRTSVGKLVYGSNGNVSKRCYRRINLGWESFFSQISFTNLNDIHGDVDLILGPNEINNYLEYKTKNDVTDVFYRLRKPKTNEETVKTYITYKRSLPYHNIS